MKSRIVFGTVICAILLTAASVTMAADRNDPAAYRLVTSEQEESGPPAPIGLDNGYSQNIGYQQASDGSAYNGGNACAIGSSCNDGCSNGGCRESCCCPRWTATADAIIYDRIGAKTRTIIGSFDPNQRELNTNDFDFGFRAGPRLSLIRHGYQCFDLELLYFMIDGWSNTQSRLITIPNVEVPIDLFIDSNWGSRLYNAEFNVRYNATCRITVLAGFRWALLRENFDLQATDLETSLVYDLKTDNNLLGFQIGGEAKLLQYGCFSVNGLVKAGLYNNHAEKQTAVSNSEELAAYSASVNHAAFLGEAGLQGSYQVTDCLTLRAGYQVMWLDGVALATSEWGATNTVDSKNTVFYHGANAGLELKF